MPAYGRLGSYDVRYKPGSKLHIYLSGPWSLSEVHTITAFRPEQNYTAWWRKQSTCRVWTTFSESLTSR